jgi:hypothetical protein
VDEAATELWCCEDTKKDVLVGINGRLGK